ncbi:MAG: restriction endonuclease [Lentimicrobiaceae bacterium]|jgi:NADH:ubiquinone oxidoreductase subunit E|nr:restriction endonuclease [Lentimicrobiaceae bacterium]
MEHTFTANIKTILEQHFGKDSEDIFNNSQLIQYLNFKTRSANKGSKARSSFANLYAIYVILEDYIANGFDKQNGYADYEGVAFVKLFTRQRELPFGSKLQNHALNNRMNAEFQKYFPDSEFIPILRNLETNKYWINEHLLKVKVGKTTYNLASVIIEIIDEYVKTKQDAFQRFIKTLEEFQEIANSEPKKVIEFIGNLLAPNVDARLFEIVSYSILKYYYHDQHIYWGYEVDKLNKENLQLFKTGRTNANDGGIDFVMRPLGRFFQVTETLDFKKYFLDIDKIQKFPITFIIKSDEPTNDILAKIKDNASKIYLVTAIVNKYMSCIEEVINIPTLNQHFADSIKLGYLKNILDEIITQSKVEFNYTETEEINEPEE